MDEGPRTPAIGDEHRTHWGGFLRYALGPIFYWCGLLDENGHPDHDKLMWTVVFSLDLGLQGYLVRHIISDHDTPTGLELSFILAFATLTAALAGGMRSFKAYLKSDVAKAQVEALDHINEAAVAALPHPPSRIEGPEAADAV
jgi:hypothetical protein